MRSGLFKKVFGENCPQVVHFNLNYLFCSDLKTLKLLGNADAPRNFLINGCVGKLGIFLTGIFFKTIPTGNDKQFILVKKRLRPASL